MFYPSSAALVRLAPRRRFRSLIAAVSRNPPSFARSTCQAIGRDAETKHSPSGFILQTHQMDLFLRATDWMRWRHGHWAAIIENQRSNIMERHFYGNPTQARMSSFAGRRMEGSASIAHPSFALVRLISGSVVNGGLRVASGC